MSSKNSKTLVDTVSSTRVRILNAALELMREGGGAEITMAAIGKRSKISRQAVYLHFADRGALMIALFQYADELRGLGAALQRVTDAPNGVAALKEFVRLQARMNPGIWALARAADAVRRTDEAVEAAWQNRLKNRLKICGQIVEHMKVDGVLDSKLPVKAVADLVWTMTSLRTWEELVLERGWTAAEYESRMLKTILRCVAASVP